MEPSMPYNFTKAGSVVAYPFSRVEIPEEKDPEIVRLVLTEAVEKWLTQKMRETEEPAENSLQSVMVFVGICSK